MTFKTALLVSLACIFQTNLHAHLKEIEKFIQTHPEIVVEYTFEGEFDKESITLQGHDQSLYASNDKVVKFIGMSMLRHQSAIVSLVRNSSKNVDGLTLTEGYARHGRPNGQENMWIITEDVEETWTLLKKVVIIIMIGDNPYFARFPHNNKVTISNDIFLCLWKGFKLEGKNS